MPRSRSGVTRSGAFGARRAALEKWLDAKALPGATPVRSSSGQASAQLRPEGPEPWCAAHRRSMPTRGASRLGPARQPHGRVPRHSPGAHRIDRYPMCRPSALPRLSTLRLAAFSQRAGHRGSRIARVVRNGPTFETPDSHHARRLTPGTRDSTRHRTDRALRPACRPGSCLGCDHSLDDPSLPSSATWRALESLRTRQSPPADASSASPQRSSRLTEGHLPPPAVHDIPGRRSGSSAIADARQPVRPTATTTRASIAVAQRDPGPAKRSVQHHAAASPMPPTGCDETERENGASSEEHGQNGSSSEEHGWFPSVAPRARRRGRSSFGLSPRRYSRTKILAIGF